MPPRVHLSQPTPRLPTSFTFLRNDRATTGIYTLSLHDALPICDGSLNCPSSCRTRQATSSPPMSSTAKMPIADRKSTRLNSSHSSISYADFCLKKKNVHSERWHSRLRPLAQNDDARLLHPSPAP